MKGKLTLEEASRSDGELADIGGEFTMKKRYVASPTSVVPQHIVTPYNTQRPPFRYIYDGPVYLPTFGSADPFPPFANSSEIELQKLGTKAIAECSPTNGPANFAEAVLELYHDGIPKLAGSLFWKQRIKSARDAARKGGSEYLNAEFAWKPLVNDIADFAEGVITLEDTVEQYLRDVGKVVRRRYSFPPIETESFSTIANGVSAVVSPSTLALYDDSTLNQGKVTRSRLTTIRRWFSGAFTYYLPKDWKDGAEARRSLAQQMLGVDLTPEVLWNLTPWSWATDWFTNIGDVLHNADAIASQGLVLRYGYIMEHSIVRDTFQLEGPTGFIPGFTGRPDAYTLISECKLRRASSPFGFGLSSGLTTRQSSIIAALGMSRAQ